MEAIEDKYCHSSPIIVLNRPYLSAGNLLKESFLSFGVVLYPPPKLSGYQMADYWLQSETKPVYAYRQSQSLQMEVQVFFSENGTNEATEVPPIVTIPMIIYL